jgi:hypothetical protein
VPLRPVCPAVLRTHLRASPIPIPSRRSQQNPIASASDSQFALHHADRDSRAAEYRTRGSDCIALAARGWVPTHSSGPSGQSRASPPSRIIGTSLSTTVDASWSPPLQCASSIPPRMWPGLSSIHPSGMDARRMSPDGSSRPPPRPRRPSASLSSVPLQRTFDPASGGAPVLGWISPLL